VNLYHSRCEQIDTNDMKTINKRKTITICSSVAFYKDIVEISKRLRKLGFKVLVPSTVFKMEKEGNFDVEKHKTWFRNKNDYKKKTRLINEHFKKVIKADAILVINKEKKGIQGYIGGNTLMEMSLAYYFKKKIFIWNDVGSDLTIEEEIRGLNPIFINQNLSRLKP